MTRKGDREKGGIGGATRDVEEVNTITIIEQIMWELPPKTTIQVVMIRQEVLQSSSLPDPACLMVREDLQWVGGNQFLLGLPHNEM